VEVVGEVVGAAGDGGVLGLGLVAGAALDGGELLRAER
jgi:hypothetical protein